MTQEAQITDTNNPGKAVPRGVLKTMAKVHVFLNKLTGGRAFNTIEGADVCFVHMIGAKSGKEIVVPVLHVPYNNGVLLVASQTGRPTNPIWYKNLVKNPEIVVRFKGVDRKMRAREANAEEKVDLWPVCDAVYSGYAQYRARTDRDIPVFVCE